MSSEGLTVEQVAAAYRVAAARSSTTHDLLAQMTVELNATLVAAQPATGEGLDVERLALAECREGRIDGSGACTHHRALAIEHAAEYAALQPASEEKG